MAHEPRGRLAVRAVAALLLVGVFSLSDSRAQDGRLGPLSPYDLDRDRRVKIFETTLLKVKDKVSSASTEIELNAIAIRIDADRRQTIANFEIEMGNALGEWSAHKSTLAKYKQRVTELNAAIEAERARISAPPPSQEEGALEGVIAQTKTELAGLEGRRDRVPLLEAQLQAMPRVGFMDSAPRERLEVELAEARANLPTPGEIDKARKDLERYEAQLIAERQKRPTPTRNNLQLLQGRLSILEAEIQVKMRDAEAAKKRFVQLRAQALGFVELYEWLEVMVDSRRQSLRGATGTPSEFVHCATMQGPFGCTGAFDGSWSTRCTTPTGYHDNRGPAKVTFSPDGWVEVRMTSAIPQQGEKPTIVGGKISADGTVVIDRNDLGHREVYRGQFKLVTSALASGAPRPIGSGTYELALRTANGQDIMRCSGSMKLN